MKLRIQSLGGACRLRIFDMAGRAIHNQLFTLESGIVAMDIPLADVTPGTYFLPAYSQRRTVFRQDP